MYRYIFCLFFSNLKKRKKQWDFVCTAPERAAVGIQTSAALFVCRLVGKLFIGSAQGRAAAPVSTPNFHRSAAATFWREG